MVEKKELWWNKRTVSNGWNAGATGWGQSYICHLQIYIWTAIKVLKTTINLKFTTYDQSVTNKTIDKIKSYKEIDKSTLH